MNYPPRRPPLYAPAHDPWWTERPAPPLPNEAVLVREALARSTFAMQGMTIHPPPDPPLVAPLLPQPEPEPEAEPETAPAPEAPPPPSWMMLEDVCDGWWGAGIAKRSRAKCTDRAALSYGQVRRLLPHLPRRPVTPESRARARSALHMLLGVASLASASLHR